MAHLVQLFDFIILFPDLFVCSVSQFIVLTSLLFFQLVQLLRLVTLYVLHFHEVLSLFKFVLKENVILLKFTTTSYCIIMFLMSDAILYLRSWVSLASRGWGCKILVGWLKALPALYYAMGVWQCLKWSKKEAGSLPQAEVECPLPRFFLFIFDLKMASFDAFLVVFYAI